MRILFAVNLDEPEETTRHAQELADRLNAELLVLHVHEPATSAPVAPVDPMSGLMGFAPYSVFDPMTEENIAQAEEDAFRAFLANRFRRAVLPAMRTGDPSTSILEDASNEGVDLIVLGKRRRSRLHRILVGSVVDEVVRRADRPVVLLPIDVPEDASAEDES